MKKFIWIGLVLVVLAALIIANLRARGGKAMEVDIATVERRDIVKVISASGSIQPKRQVDVSATSMGKVTRLAVAEGQRVEVGDFLLEIDPATFESAVDQLTAAVRGAQATQELEQAQLKKAEYDLQRTKEMSSGGFVSEEALRDAEVAVEIGKARVRTARESLSQARANLQKAKHDLDEVRITAEMSGVVTQLNVEEGEAAIMGTINNPGTVLLTIADLSEIEAEVSVDETEVVFIEVGQPARVTLDAFPDTSFAGEVSEVGNSALRASLGMGQDSVDFKVVILLTDRIPGVRPGLTASVDVTVAERKGVVAVPIQCLTVRDSRRVKRGDDEQATRDEPSRDVEGVWVVEGGEVTFREVRVGIAGEKFFHVVTGLSADEQVVSGPFQAISDLRDGDRIKARKSARDES